MQRTAAFFYGILFLIHASSSSELLPIASKNAEQHAPFIVPSSRNRLIFLFKRGSCPADHTSCSSLNAPEACCASGTNCARDQSGTIACCPVNYVCVGNLGGSVSGTGTQQQTNYPTGPYVATVTVTSTAGVTNSNSPQTGGSSITGSVGGGGSTVPNSYYPFVYMPTSFPNADVCSSYWTSCQMASTACFQSLAGVNGVTIGGMAGGMTQFGTTGTAQLSASSICSGLSQSACYGVQSTQCALITGSGGGGTTFVQNGRGPRETGCPGILYAAAAGVAVGALGIVV